MMLNSTLLYQMTLSQNDVDLKTFCPMTFCPMTFCPMTFCPMTFCPMTFCPMTFLFAYLLCLQAFWRIKSRLIWPHSSLHFGIICLGH